MRYMCDDITPIRTVDIGLHDVRTPCTAYPTGCRVGLPHADDHTSNTPWRTADDMGPWLDNVVDLTATSFASTLPLYQHCDIASYFVSVGIEGHGVVGGTCCVTYLDTTFATH